jgi:hypothetical protein
MKGSDTANVVAGFVLNPKPSAMPAPRGYAIAPYLLTVLKKNKVKREKKNKQVPSATSVLEYPQKKGEVRHNREETRAVFSP